MYFLLYSHLFVVFAPILNMAVSSSKASGYVVAQFYPWFNFDFLLSFSMLIYDKENETKGNQN